MGAALMHVASPPRLVLGTSLGYRFIMKTAAVQQLELASVTEVSEWTEVASGFALLHSGYSPIIHAVQTMMSSSKITYIILYSSMLYCKGWEVARGLKNYLKHLITYGFGQAVSQ
jgi:hypothetical protein